MLHELSEKQKTSLKDSTARLNIWEGSVRSGKSFSALLRFIEFCASDVRGDFAIIGKTEDALKRNVIAELYNLLGDKVHYSSGNREIRLFSRKIHVIGANDDRAEGKIRGCTLAGVLIDEITMIPENFFTMLLSRLSVAGAKLFGTTNPDSPFHWLKINFLDRAEELDMKRFGFILDDNPSLTDEYKNSLKKEYRGLWYSRFIDGRWVMAEGAVYDFFDNATHCIKQPPCRAIKYVVGVDYGTTNPTGFVLLGQNLESYPNMWVEKEYYWDSKANLRQKTDIEYAEELVKFMQGYYIQAIHIDPSAASFIAECRRQGITNIQDANNDVLDGIRFVSQLFTGGTLKICENCTSLIKEMQTYVWDEAAALRGVERPKKASDHLLDALRYACLHYYHNTVSNQSSYIEEYNKTLISRL